MMVPKVYAAEKSGYAAPVVLSNAAPAVLSYAAPAVLSNAAPAVLSKAAPAVLSNAAPAVLSNAAYGYGDLAYGYGDLAYGYGKPVYDYGNKYAFNYEGDHVPNVVSGNYGDHGYVANLNHGYAPGYALKHGY